MIHVLWFDQGLQVVLQNLGEVILELRSTKVLEDFLPVWRILEVGNCASVCEYPAMRFAYVVSSKIRFELSGQNLQRRALSDTVSSHKTKHLTRSWGRESMQFERIGGITMGDLRLQVCRQVDDRNSFERTPAAGINEKNVGHGDKTHFLTQIPQPMHRNSEMKAILSVGLTSIHSLPDQIHHGSSTQGQEISTVDTDPFSRQDKSRYFLGKCM